MTTNLTPPDRKPEDPRLQPSDEQFGLPPKKNLFFILFVAFSLFVLLDFAVLAYFFLAGKDDAAPPSGQQEQTVGDKVDPGNKSSGRVQKTVDPAARTSAEALRERWMHLQAMAEAEAVRTWAGGEYAEIIKAADQGELLLSRGEYRRAGQRFQQVAHALETLEAQRPALFAKALAAGRSALAEENSAAAAEAFTRALALSPEDTQAEHGLARARNLDQVLALYRKGLVLEKEGGLRAAEKQLSQAGTLDPEYQPAALALARVQAQLHELEFQQAMGGFLQAMAVEDVTRAKEELGRAARLSPQAEAVRDGARQLRRLTLQQQLGRLRREYVRFIASEQWQQAKERCEQALKLDPQAAFALKGLQTASRRLALDRALQGILAAPQRLQEAGPLQEARQTLAVAESVPDPGPRLKDRISSVRRLLDLATRTVLLVVQSDNATEVVIYRVGRLGRFNRRELQLRPGRYTAVGSRPGYRDVRREFEIKAGTPRTILRIRCEEVI